MSETEPKAPTPLGPGVMRRKVILNFGLFGIFFVFYVGAAVIQTPNFSDLAGVRTLGMPLGLLLSLAIFPLSWIILVVWFWRAK